jgi:peroxiredoxin family protein
MTTIAPPPAPPSAAAPPPLTPGSRNAIRAIIVIAAAALVVGSVVAVGVTAWGINSLRVSTDGKDLPNGMRSLVIDAGDATVRVKSDSQATAARVDLRTLNSTRGGQQRLEVTTDAGDTQVFVTPDTKEFMDFGWTGEVTVTLPSKLAQTLSVTTAQVDGTLIVDADLDRLVARNSDGNITLNGGARVVEITAKDGDVVSRTPLSVRESFVVESFDGDVDVTFADAPRTLTATTRDGDVAVSLPQPGPYLVKASGDSSRVQVPLTTDPARAASQVTVRSDGGDVEVDLRHRG